MVEVYVIFFFVLNQKYSWIFCLSLHASLSIKSMIDYIIALLHQLLIVS